MIDTIRLITTPGDARRLVIGCGRSGIITRERRLDTTGPVQQRRKCGSCGARENADGSLPCGH